MPTPAGWYEDPDQPGSQRFWDGAEWTELRTPPGYYPAQDGRPNTLQYWDGVQWTDDYRTTEPLADLRRKNNRKGLIIIGTAVVIALVAWAVSSLGGDDKTTAQPSARPTVSETPYDPADYCNPAEAKALKQLARGATPYNLGKGLKLTNGWSLRSSDYQLVYFVAAQIPSGKVAVFKVNSNPSNLPPGAALDAQAESVNGVASDNFTYPYAPMSGGATMKDAGAREVFDCASAS